MIGKKSIYDMSITELIQELNWSNSTRREIRRLLRNKIKAHTDIKLSTISDKKLIELVEDHEEK